MDDPKLAKYFLGNQKHPHCRSVTVIVVVLRCLDDFYCMCTARDDLHCAVIQDELYRSQVVCLLTGESVTFPCLILYSVKAFYMRPSADIFLLQATV